VYGVHRYLPTTLAALVGGEAFELAGAEHLAYAAGGELQDPRCLADGIEVFPIHATHPTGANKFKRLCDTPDQNNRIDTPLSRGYDTLGFRAS
jgi:hypothetical protein